MDDWRAERLGVLRREVAQALDVLERLPKVTEEYLSLTGEARNGFGHRAGIGADFIYRMRDGRDFCMSTARRALHYIAIGSVPPAATPPA